MWPRSEERSRTNAKRHRAPKVSRSASQKKLRSTRQECADGRRRDQAPGITCSLMQKEPGITPIRRSPNGRRHSPLHSPHADRDRLGRLIGMGRCGHKIGCKVVIQCLWMVEAPRDRDTRAVACPGERGWISQLGRKAGGFRLGRTDAAPGHSWPAGSELGRHPRPVSLSSWRASAAYRHRRSHRTSRTGPPRGCRRHEVVTVMVRELFDASAP